MSNNNETATKVIDFTANKVRKTDPFSLSVIMENVRLIELTMFFGKAVRSLIKAVQDWNNRNKLNRELSTMPDYLLWDIGIRREQIPSVVAGKIEKGFLGLNTTGDQIAPVLYKDKDDTPLAA